MDNEIKIKELITKNIDCKTEIKINDKIITIKATIQLPELQKKIGFSDITSTYKGYKENNKNIVIKE